ncbi:hypothetical protein QYF36_021027 [Acer negundo]|nr:hypothetical protein QYF36_021027 [Acer negundo]
MLRLKSGLLGIGTKIGVGNGTTVKGREKREKCAMSAQKVTEKFFGFVCFSAFTYTEKYLWLLLVEWINFLDDWWVLKTLDLEQEKLREQSGFRFLELWINYGVQQRGGSEGKGDCRKEDARWRLFRGTKDCSQGATTLPRS